MDPIYALLGLVMILGGICKGALGFGFPLIVTPIVAIIFDTQTSVVSISVPALLSNAIILARGGMTRADFRRFAPALALVVLGTVLGANLLSLIPPRALSILIGSITIAYCLITVTKFQITVSPAVERYTTPIVGALGGLLGGATNISGPIFGIYLHNLKLPKLAYVYTISLLFITSNLAQVVSYSQLNLFTEQRILIAVLSCIPMAIGLGLGMWAQGKLNQLLFSRLVLGLLFVTGLSLIVRNLS